MTSINLWRVQGECIGWRNVQLPSCKYKPACLPQRAFQAHYCDNRTDTTAETPFYNNWSFHVHLQTVSIEHLMCMMCFGQWTSWQIIIGWAPWSHDPYWTETMIQIGQYKWVGAIGRSRRSYEQCVIANLSIMLRYADRFVIRRPLCVQSGSA